MKYNIGLANTGDRQLNESDTVKIIILAIISATLIACSNSPKNSPTQSSDDPIFRMGMRMGCNIKYPNSKKMCECHANVMHDATPPELRRRSLTDPGAKMELVAVMIDNSDKLDACGEKPPADNNEKQAVPTRCYEGAQAPFYYLGDNESDTLSLTPEETSLLNNVSRAVTDEELKRTYFESVTDEMSEIKKMLGKRMNADNDAAVLDESFAKATENSIQCSDKILHKFYTASEVDALYRLFYAGYPRDTAMESIFNHGVRRRNNRDVTAAQQRIELRKYSRCEMKICMNK